MTKILDFAHINMLYINYIVMLCTNLFYVYMHLKYIAKLVLDNKYVAIDWQLIFIS